MLSNIELKQFRSYQDDSFEFSPGVNIIVGPNASGKSNLLEAVLVMARGASYRAADTDLIMFGKPWARLDAALSDGVKRTLKITKSGDKSTKAYVFDEKPYARLSYAHTLPVVLFEPNNLLLLHGQPDARRLYMDDLLEQLEPGFAATRKHYRRVLSQRNALLKRQPHDIEQQIFVWNVRLSELGGHIASQRIALVEKLNQKLGGIYKNIAQAKTKVTAEYESQLPFENYETALLRKLEASLEKDILRGFTAVGPHRDDLVLRFDNVAASETASRGETRTALLALKVFELELLESVRGQKPLLLLDDVFSELDGKRRHALTEYLQNYQTFITTTDADVVLHSFAQSANLIALK
ncbi:MAG: replication and repair protein RecF [Candidatus Saccharibacteria bacterium]|nr:replication and repair protein RecF [Candidatus Saccharibacteria bacterium]